MHTRAVETVKPINSYFQKKVTCVTFSSPMVTRFFYFEVTWVGDAVFLFASVYEQRISLLFFRYRPQHTARNKYQHRHVIIIIIINV